MKNTGLVPGVPQDEPPPVAIKVLRGFYDKQGLMRTPGEILEVPGRLAHQLIANRKAERVPDPPRVTVTVDPEPDEVPKLQTAEGDEVALPGAELPQKALPPRKQGRFFRGPK